MRRVKVFEMKRNGVLQSGFEKVEIGMGIFHQFGVSYEEFETGPGNFSTAIVEMKDGIIKNVPVELIQFIDVDTDTFLCSKCGKNVFHHRLIGKYKCSMCGMEIKRENILKE